MIDLKRFAILTLAASSLAAVTATDAFAKGACMNKAGQGTAVSEDGAKFQAMEAILQATDWGLWAAWMANGSTPGYKVGKVKYRCKKGGIGFECTGQTTICKK
jgi:hypothetical protein